MARYIDADFLIEQLQPAKNAEWNKKDYSKSKSEMIEDFCTELKNTRIADVVEVRHGEWVKNKPNAEMMKEFHDIGIGTAMALNSIYWTCSCCGTWGTPRYKYCSQCGAKMDGGETE